MNTPVRDNCMTVIVQEFLDNLEYLKPSIEANIQQNLHLYLIDNYCTDRHVIRKTDWLHRYTTDNRIEIVKRAIEVLTANVVEALSKERAYLLGEIQIRPTKTDERDGVEIQVNFMVEPAKTTYVNPDDLSDCELFFPINPGERGEP